MIKFFRTIRQQSLTEHKVSKYILYAIGEIFLVVIGILLALQINAWNQDRINTITEKEYYERFLDDVLLDEEIINNHIEETNSRLHGANLLIKKIQNDDNNLDSIAPLILMSVSRSAFGMRPIQTTFEDIKSSGNIALIQDLELRKHIDYYYEFMNNLSTVINNNAAGLGARMTVKEDLIGTGLLHLTKQQNGLDSSIVNIQQLEAFSQLTQENKMILMNDAVYYAAIASRNLQHFEVLRKKVKEMKEILYHKCNRETAAH